MHFSTSVVATLTATTSVPASPAALAPRSLSVAGHVVTDKGVTYQMIDFNETKVFDNKVDNSEYPRPVKYQIEAGFHCIFYRKGSRGPGSPTGEFEGPTEGTFDEWVEAYKCWSDESNKAIAVRDNVVASVDLCGFVRTPDGATHSLDDTGKLPFGHDPKDFGVKGAYYYPQCFHVVDGCTCGFYTVHNSRIGPEKISENKGVADGTFPAGVAARYACWTGA